MACKRRHSPFSINLRRPSPFFIRIATASQSNLKFSCKQEERMINVFGATSTTDEVLSGINLQGKRFLVTGVSAGLGVETARTLAAHGAQVVGAARDLNKAEGATAQVRKDAAANGGSFELVTLDLASLKSVRAG